MAASIAGSIYLALSKAEKAARPEALAEISVVLKDPSWSRLVRPGLIVERLFVWTFGERHFSAKCISRSAISTVLVVTSLIIFHIVHTGDSGFIANYRSQLGVFAGLTVLNSFVPDYVALLKTRAFLRINHRLSTLLILCLDLVSSIAISGIFILLFFTPFILFQFGLFHLSFLPSIFLGVSNPASEFRTLTTPGPPGIYPNALYSAFYFSTLFTSVWLALIVLSTTLLKFLAPLQRFTIWFFDVQKHPLEAVGIVTGALVMLGAAIWAVVRRL